jgi:hypothetical protein
MIRDWVALNMTPGIGPRAAAKLLERFGSAEAVFGGTRAELEQLRLLPEAVDSIVAQDLLERAELESEQVKLLGAEILILDDGVYPSLLREIFDPPITLYVVGLRFMNQTCCWFLMLLATGWIRFQSSQRCVSSGMRSIRLPKRVMPLIPAPWPSALRII